MGRTAQQHVVQLDIAVDDLRVVGVQVRQAVGHLLRPCACIRIAVHYFPHVRHLRRQREAVAQSGDPLADTRLADLTRWQPPE